MFEAFDKCLKSFDDALKKKEKGKFNKDDVKKIYEAAHELFDGRIELNNQQIHQLCDRWVEIAGDKLDKGAALRKLHGTSRAESIQSVLLSTL
ncbi:MAG: hypothetical protein KDK62_03010 [Chlamydiia bacterium]|nr:hypothetical protein [Chlamydiia bacterium]